jgi:hypothetical protein
LKLTTISFGVVTGATVKVFPTFPVTVARFIVNSTTPYSQGLWDASAYFLQQGAKIRDAHGLQGYFYIYPNGFHSVLHMPDNYANLDNARKAVEPLKKKMEELTGAKPNEIEFYQHKSYRDWYIAEMGDEDMEDSGEQFLSWNDGAYGEILSSADAMMNPMLVVPYVIANSQRLAKLAAAAAPSKKVKRHGPDEAELSAMGMPAAPATPVNQKVKIPRTQPMGRTYLDSRLLSDKHVNSVSLKVLADTINATFPRFPGNHIRGFLYGGGEMAKPAIDATGVLPQWRQATYHFIINAVPGDTRNDYTVAALAKLFPDAGAYVNEVSMSNYLKKSSR